MIRVVIIEDEKHCINHINQLLNTFKKEIQVIGEYDSVKNSVINLKSLNPDLVFMDVELKDGNCFDILKDLNAINFEIIFTTAHSKFAVDAFEYSAVHYLLKPLDSAKFNNAILKVKEKLNSRKTNEKLENIIHNLQFSGSIDKKIAIPTTKGLSFFKVGKIAYIQAEGNYSSVFFENGKSCLATKKIKYYEDLLDDRYFFRTHQSYLVNLSFVDKYINHNKNNFVILNNATEIPVSVRRKSNFINFLEKNKRL